MIGPAPYEIIGPVTIAAIAAAKRNLRRYDASACALAFCRFGGVNTRPEHRKRFRCFYAANARHGIPPCRSASG